MQKTDHSTVARNGIQSVEVGYGLITAMAAATGPLMLRDLARAANMSAAKAHRYLVSFQRLGMGAQDPQSRYALGPVALRLGLAALSQVDAVQLARQRIPSWLAQWGHTVALAVWGNHGPTIVHWAAAPNGVHVALRLGDVMPLQHSATGRCFLSFMPPSDRNASTQQALLQTEQQADAVAQPEARATNLEAVIQQTRQAGIASVQGNLIPGVSGLCGPVFDSQGHLALGVVTLGQSTRFNANPNGELAQQVKAACAALSQDIGHRAPQARAAAPGH